MRRTGYHFLAIALAAPIALASQDEAPRALTALAAKAGLSGPLAAWCEGEFRPGRRGAFAVAVQTTPAAGRYLVIEKDGTVNELSAFRGRADLSCYTAAEARRLNASIAASETIHGGVKPVGRTTVICGFVDETNAVCWQYSPSGGSFRKVGEWVT